MSDSKMVDLGIYEHEDKYYRVSIPKELAKAFEKKEYRYQSHIETFEQFAIALLKCEIVFGDGKLKNKQFIEQIPTPRKAFKYEKPQVRDIVSLRNHIETVKGRTDNDALAEKYGTGGSAAIISGSKKSDASPVLSSDTDIRNAKFPLFIKQLSPKGELDTLVELYSSKTGRFYFVKSSKREGMSVDEYSTEWFIAAKKNLLFCQFIEESEFAKLCKTYEFDYKPF